MGAPTNIPPGSVFLGTDTSGKQRFQMPNGQVFVIFADGNIATEWLDYRVVTLHARAYHPITGEACNGAVIGTAKVKYGPPPNYMIPGALVHEGKAYEKYSDDAFRAVE